MAAHIQGKLRLDELESLMGSIQEAQDVYYTELVNKETGLAHLSRSSLCSGAVLGLGDYRGHFFFTYSWGGEVHKTKESVVFNICVLHLM